MLRCAAAQVLARMLGSPSGEARVATEPTPNTKLAGMMERAKRSNKGLAADVRAVAARHGVTLRTDHTLVKKWLDGATPRRRTALYIAEALSEKLGYPVSLDDIGMQNADSASDFDTALIYPNSVSAGQAALLALAHHDAIAAT